MKASLKICLMAPGSISARSGAGRFPRNSFQYAYSRRLAGCFIKRSSTRHVIKVVPIRYRLPAVRLVCTQNEQIACRTAGRGKICAGGRELVLTEPCRWLGEPPLLGCGHVMRSDATTADLGKMGGEGNSS